MHVLIIILVIALVIAICFAISYKTTSTKYAESAADLTQHVSSLQTECDNNKKIIADLQENIRDYEERITVVTDDFPEEDTPYNRALKLTNEIVPYIVERNGKIALYVFNKKVVD